MVEIAMIAIQLLTIGLLILRTKPQKPVIVLGPSPRVDVPKLLSEIHERSRNMAGKVHIHDVEEIVTRHITK